MELKVQRGHDVLTDASGGIPRMELKDAWCSCGRSRNLRNAAGIPRMELKGIILYIKSMM